MGSRRLCCEVGTKSRPGSDSCSHILSAWLKLRTSIRLVNRCLHVPMNHQSTYWCILAEFAVNVHRPVATRRAARRYIRAGCIANRPAPPSRVKRGRTSILGHSNESENTINLAPGHHTNRTCRPDISTIQSHPFLQDVSGVT
jgi:hypothetical protein